jgi:hypothetical protein
MENFASEERASLLGPCVSDKGKEYYDIETW